MLEEVMNKLAEFLKLLPSLIDQGIKEEADAQTKLLDLTATECFEKVKKFQIDMDKLVKEIVFVSDEQYIKLKGARNRLDKIYAEIGNIGNPIPHNLKDLCAIAERFSCISDDQWKRVIELAKALGEKRND